MSTFSVLGLQSIPGGILTLWNLLSLMGLTLYILYRSRLEYFTLKYISILILLLCSVLATVIASVFAGGTYPGYAIGQIISLIYVGIFMVILGKMKIAPQAMNKFNNYYVFFAIFACVINMAKNYASINPSFLTVSDPYELSLSSFFTNRNTFGFILALAIIIIIGNWDKLVGYKVKIAKLTGLFILALNLILSLSRGALLFTAIFLILYILFTKSITAQVKALVLLALVLGTIYLLLGPLFVLNTVVRPETGLTHRDVVQNLGAGYFRSHNILFGSGPDAPFSFIKSPYGYTSFHSSYITLLVTGGITLLASYILLYLLAFRNIIKIRRANRQLGSFLLATLIAFLAYSIIETNNLLSFEVNSFIITMYLLFLPIYVRNYYSELLSKKARL